MSLPSWTDLPKKTINLSWPTTKEWQFTPLSEPLLSAELKRLASPISLYDTDAVSIQPWTQSNKVNQDRYVIQNWELPNGVWSFQGLFDGHAGSELATHTAVHLPDCIQSQLSTFLSTNPDPAAIIDEIPSLLSSAIQSFDQALVKPVLDAFPNPSALAEMSDEQVTECVNKASISDLQIVLCACGTTAIIALTDPCQNNLWVASLGDCAAGDVSLYLLFETTRPNLFDSVKPYNHDQTHATVLGTKGTDGTWSAKVLSTAHNGSNDDEIARVESEHPGEPDAMLNGRVLGAIAVTRAIGDFYFKLPAPYSDRLFVNAKHNERLRNTLKVYTLKNVTPPYISSIPDIRHADLTVIKPQPTFLILTSDGLVDLSDDRLKLEEVLAKQWVTFLGQEEDAAPVTNIREMKENLALKLLRHSMGGEDTDRVSALLTVEMEQAWMDDTTVLVRRLFM